MICSKILHILSGTLSTGTRCTVVELIEGFFARTIAGLQKERGETAAGDDRQVPPRPVCLVR